MSKQISETSSNPQQGRDRAKRRKVLGTCERCQERPAIDRHHINNDPLDNRAENIMALCRRCHMQIDGRYNRIAKTSQ